METGFLSRRTHTIDVSLRRHYHICLKATLWNTLQRLDGKDYQVLFRWGRLYVNRNPNGGCNVPKVAKFLDE